MGWKTKYLGKMENLTREGGTGRYLYPERGTQDQTEKGAQENDFSAEIRWWTPQSEESVVVPGRIGSDR